MYLVHQELLLDSWKQLFSPKCDLVRKQQSDRESLQLLSHVQEFPGFYFQLIQALMASERRSGLNIAVTIRSSPEKWAHGGYW